MIKIDLDSETRKEIRLIYLKDARKAPSGIIKVLKKDEIKRLLNNKYLFLYNYLYDVKGELIENKVEELAFLDRVGMKKSIERWGIIGEKESEELLSQVFQYKNFSERKIACDILNAMKIEVCPYCNRLYIHTIKSRKVRAQFDHYYPKRQYPYLALSLYNLIPSCAVCNTVKSNLDTIKAPLLYPYDEEFGYENRFVLEPKTNQEYVKIWQGVSDEFDLKIEAKTRLKEIICRQDDKLHLSELYNEHKSYIMDIIKSRNINSPDRIRDLYLRYGKLFATEAEVKGLLYMTNLGKEHWGKRPLAKLTYDIDKQFNPKGIDLW